VIPRFNLLAKADQAPGLMLAFVTQAALRRRSALAWFSWTAGLGVGCMLANAPAHAWGELRWDEVKQKVRNSHPEVRPLSVAELRNWQSDRQRPAPLLIDSRSREEFDISHIEGAVHAATVAEAWALLAQQAPGVSVVVYCSVGLRSAELVSKLQSRAQRQRPQVSPSTAFYNLEGSLFEWANQGLPLVNAQGSTALVHPFNKRWGALLNRERWAPLR
jgi:rhodanese-related sulfurtransferase